MIVATKGNMVRDEEDLADRMHDLEKLAQRYGIKGGVLDYRCRFMKRGQGEIIKPIDE